MTIVQEIQEWGTEQASKYCRECKSTCCNGVRHIIGFKKDEPAVGLFKELNVPVYALEDLNEDTVRQWILGNHHNPIRTKKKIKIPMPSVVEYPDFEHIVSSTRWLRTTSLGLYVQEYCPAYDYEIGCTVHGDPRRPNACKSYPFISSVENDKLVVKPQSCHLSKIKEVKSRFRKRFPDVEWRTG